MILIRKPSLTPKERAVLNLLARGRSAKEIANQQSRSFRTIEKHIENLKAKLNAYTRSQIIDAAEKWGYIRVYLHRLTLVSEVVSRILSFEISPPKKMDCLLINGRFLLET